MEEIGVRPDMIIGCVGGGSNFAGLAFPFIGHQLKEGRTTRFIAVEPESCPSLTRGELRYDHGDGVGLTPLLYMYTLGMDFVPPPIHAGRSAIPWHGAPGQPPRRSRASSNPGRSDSQVFDAAKVFLKAEGILPAPESSHAIAAVDRRGPEGQGRRRKKSHPVQPVGARVSGYLRFQRKRNEGSLSGLSPDGRPVRGVPDG